MDKKLNCQSTYICEADLKDGEMRGTKVGDQWILVVNFKNQYYALEAACTHSGYPLFKGTLDKDGVVTCSLHYAKFQCQTGAIVSDPRRSVATMGRGSSRIHGWLARGILDGAAPGAALRGRSMRTRRRQSVASWIAGSLLVVWQPRRPSRTRKGARPSDRLHSADREAGRALSL